MEELEIEKRYFVPEEDLAALQAQADLNSAEFVNDFYVPKGDQHKDLRLRQKDNKYMITRKSPIEQDGVPTMVERTLELTSEEFAALTQGITTNVEKTRYLVDIDGRRGELDVFSGRHAGLAILEIEFKDAPDYKAFTQGNNLHLLDITGYEPLASGRLAEGSIEDAQKALKSLA